MSLWLTQEELFERTGFKRHSKQRAELARQGVPFNTRLDGFPLVLRAYFDRLTPTTKRREPRLDLVG